MLKDAEHVIVVMSSTAGTAKDVVDRLREGGKKVGLLRPKLFRPFPYEEIAKALSKAKTVAVLDRSSSFGAKSNLSNSLFPQRSNISSSFNLVTCSGLAKAVKKSFIPLKIKR